MTAKLDRNPQKLKSDSRKAEIVRLITLKPMGIVELHKALSSTELDLTKQVLNSALYRLRSDGLIAVKKGRKFAIYSVIQKAQSTDPQKLKGFPPPRRISADSEVMRDIMIATPLRKITWGIAGNSNFGNGIF